MDHYTIHIVIEIVLTGVFAFIGWGIKNAVAANLEPIRKDINLLQKTVTDISGFLTLHNSDKYAHPAAFEQVHDDYMRSSEIESRFKAIEEKIEWYDRKSDR